MKPWMFILSYLGAAVAANTLVSALGPWALAATAVILIPFDLTARDMLHERWNGRWLWPRMAGLVLAGSMLSFATASAAVCVASCIAFAAAGATDAVAYWSLGDRSRLVKMNASNVCSAVVDSIVFPAVAFGVFNPALLVTQAGLKIAGGVVWSVLLEAVLRTRSRVDGIDDPHKS